MNTQMTSIAVPTPAVRYDQSQGLSATQIEQALSNLGITNIEAATITSGGFLQLTNTTGSVFHVGLNMGNAPS